MNTLERFLAKVIKTDACWFWTGSNNGAGYGEIRVRNRKVYAHRWAYEHIGGRSIPEGHQLDHLCRNAACVNPAHLEAVLPAINVQRGLAAGPHPERRRDVCTNGHPFDANEYKRPDGKGRNCRLCVRDRAREYMRRKTGYYDRHPDRNG